jgi:hypothetical protein
MNQILKPLTEGDLRSIGKANDVVQQVLEDPELFPDVVEGLTSDDPIVRMRSADVIEKVAKQHPEYLQPFKSQLINEISLIDQKEVQWHVAQMFSYLTIDQSERDVITKILLTYISQNTSTIVKTFSMQTLAIFAERDADLRPQIIQLIECLMETGSPAIVSRGKKLLSRLKS